MPDLKISDMTPATSVGPDDVFPIVQAGANFKATVAQLSGNGDSCRISASNPQTLTYGTYANLVMDTAVWDNNGLSGGTPFLITIQRDGFYLVTCACGFNGIGDSTTAIEVELSIGAIGSEKATGTWLFTQDTLSLNMCNLSTILKLFATDTLETSIVVRSATGSQVSTIVSGMAATPYLAVQQLW